MNEKQILGIGTRIKHPAFGDGVIIRLHLKAYDVCFFTYGVKSVGKEYDALEIIEAIPAEEVVTFTDAERGLMRILRTWSDVNDVVPLGDKWNGGTMILKPKEDNYKSVEFPIETFFHKIVMIRDRLRVMEQRINASALTDEQKVDLQQYITRIYGSLTSFNILFKNKEEIFVGQKSE